MHSNCRKYSVSISMAKNWVLIGNVGNYLFYSELDLVSSFVMSLRLTIRRTTGAVIGDLTELVKLLGTLSCPHCEPARTRCFVVLEILLGSALPYATFYGSHLLGFDRESAWLSRQCAHFYVKMLKLQYMHSFIKAEYFSFTH